MTINELFKYLKDNFDCTYNLDSLLNTIDNLEDAYVERDNELSLSSLDDTYFIDIVDKNTNKRSFISYKITKDGSICINSICKCR